MEFVFFCRVHYALGLIGCDMPTKCMNRLISGGCPDGSIRFWWRGSGWVRVDPIHWGTNESLLIYEVKGLGKEHHHRGIPGQSANH